MNLKYLQRLKPLTSKARVELLAKYDYGQSDIIVDPYFVSYVMCNLTRFIH